MCQPVIIDNGRDVFIYDEGSVSLEYLAENPDVDLSHRKLAMLWSIQRAMCRIMQQGYFSVEISEMYESPDPSPYGMRVFRVHAKIKRLSADLTQSEPTDQEG